MIDEARVKKLLKQINNDNDEHLDTKQFLSREEHFQLLEMMLDMFKSGKKMITQISRSGKGVPPASAVVFDSPKSYWDHKHREEEEDEETMGNEDDEEYNDHGEGFSAPEDTDDTPPIGDRIEAENAARSGCTHCYTCGKTHRLGAGFCSALPLDKKEVPHARMEPGDLAVLTGHSFCVLCGRVHQTGGDCYLAKSLDDVEKTKTPCTGQCGRLFGEPCKCVK